MDEELFWANYYRRTIYLRAVGGLDGQAARDEYNDVTAESIIFEPSFEADDPVRLVKLKENSAAATTAATTSSSSSSASSSNDVEKAKIKEEQLALAAEVEEELNDGDLNIDLDDLEDLNLDDVDEYENIDNNDEFDNDEIEAQITRELDNKSKGEK